jgi:hypothetical protein
VGGSTAAAARVSPKKAPLSDDVMVHIIANYVSRATIFVFQPFMPCILTVELVLLWAK